MERTTRFVRDAFSLLCLACIVWGLITLPSCLLVAAPGPTRKKVVDPLTPLIGTWEMRWSGISATTTFHATGGYECFWQGRSWVGTWVIKDGVLSVKEVATPASAPVNWYIWGVKLGATGLSGVPGSGPSFSLHPLPLRKI